MKAIYIGAGIDIRPIKYFNDIKIFHYFDGQPNSEFGIKKCPLPNGHDGFSRPNFIPNLDEVMKKINMKLINVYDNIRIYSNNVQIVFYHTNTAIPEHYEKIKNTIKNFDTLIVVGHDPDSIFLDATRKKIHFIGMEDTVYNNEDEYEYGPDNPNSIIYRMHTDNIKSKFNSFSYLRNNKIITTFDYWNEFYEFYLKRQKMHLIEIAAAAEQ